MSFSEVVAVLFDLDGTLTDYEAGCEAGLRAALKTFNNERERPFAWDIFLEGYNAVIEAESAWSSKYGFKVSAKDNRIRRFGMLFNGLGINPGPVISEMADAYGLGRVNGTRLYPEVIEVLDYLIDKYRLGVVTEGSVETQKQQLTGQKIIGYFDSVIISGETLWHKPDLNLYSYAASKLKVEPENIVMVGDRLDWDIKPAKELGMQTVYLNKDKKNNDSDEAVSCADKVIFNLKELKSML